MNKALKYTLITAGAASGTLGALLIIYFYNLDMKFIARFVDPVLQKHYNQMEHNQYV